MHDFYIYLVSLLLLQWSIPTPFFKFILFLYVASWLNDVNSDYCNGSFFMGRYFHKFHEKLALCENIIVNSYASAVLLQ